MDDGRRHDGVLSMVPIADGPETYVPAVPVSEPTRGRNASTGQWADIQKAPITFGRREHPDLQP